MKNRLLMGKTPHRLSIPEKSDLSSILRTIGVGCSLLVGSYATGHFIVVHVSHIRYHQVSIAFIREQQ
jgi:hypothetical protein